MASAMRGHLGDKVLSRREKLRKPRKLHPRKLHPRKLHPRKSIPHESTDPPIEATPEDLEQIRLQLSGITRMLEGVFGHAYDGGRVSRQARARAADLI